MKALIQDIWNNLIAIPRNQNGSFQLSPAELKRIVEQHLGKEQKQIIYKSFQIGKVYQTKYQTGEKFCIEEIKYKYCKELKKEVPYYFNGTYVGQEHIGICPINPERLIQETY